MQTRKDMNKNDEAKTTTDTGNPCGSGVMTGCTDGMTVLDLFSGIGGFSLGLERAGMRTIAFCEIEEFPRRVLRKHWPGVPIFEDVRKLHAKDLPESPSIIVGGYPCQPFSTAGKRRGQEDDRHLWPEMFRLVRECRPSWVVAENVAGHITMGLDQVLFDLESEGYSCWTFVIPACAVNAPHRRDRLWIMANSKGKRLEEWRHRSAEGGGKDKTSEESRRDRPPGRCLPQEYTAIEQWIIEPSVGRVVNGFPGRVDRLKGLGNSVVPQIPELIGRAIAECG